MDCLSEQELAFYIARSVRYNGGFLYSGETWLGPGSNKLSQTQAWAKAPWTDGDQEVNLRVLREMPVGSYLYERFSGTNGAQIRKWVKGPNGWEPGDWEED